uniref:Lipocalin n=1 Tax=Amblyomma americanum TaxID=6943 RepID=A0A0C9RX02_AMBAM
MGGAVYTKPAMDKWQILVGFLLALYMPLVRPQEILKHPGDAKPEDADIYEFLKKTQKLWVYNTTAKGKKENIVCTCDVQNNITTNETTFYRTKDGKTKEPEELLKARFIKWNDDEDVFNAMEIINISGKSFSSAVRNT